MCRPAIHLNFLVGTKHFLKKKIDIRVRLIQTASTVEDYIHLLLCANFMIGQMVNMKASDLI